MSASWPGPRSVASATGGTPVNLRGSIVPIVDLRMRFSMERAEFNAVTVIIVLSVQSATGRRDFGVVVDGVSDVVDVNKAEGGFVCRGGGGLVYGALVRGDRVVQVTSSAIPQSVAADTLTTAISDQLATMSAG